MLKRWICAALAVCCLFLGGCMENIQLKDRAIVQEVGIDYEDGEYQITLQVFSPEGSSGNGSFDTTKTNNLVVEARGETITQAFQHAADQLGKAPFLGINQLVVVGMDTAEEGIDHLIDYFNSYDGSRANAYVVVSRGKASEIVAAQIKVGILPASAIVSMAQGKEQTGTASFSTIFSVISAGRTPGMDITIPILDVREGPTGEVTPEMVGSGILVDNRLETVLDSQQGEAIQWAKGKVRQSSLSVETEELGKIAVTVHDSSSRISANMENGSPSFEISIDAHCALYEVNGRRKTLEIQDIPLLEKAAEEKLREEVEAVLDLTMRQQGADLLGLGRRIYKQYPGEWEVLQKDWHETIKTVPVTVKTRLVIDRVAPMANADIQ